MTAADDVTLPPDLPQANLAASPPGFVPGDLVAGRYRIGRLIARRGLGDLYEAEDGELGERVALQTMRAARAGDERFRRELLLARRVTHPHVCRVFDLGSEGELSFFTMELLRGETLAAILARGRLAPGQALALVEQMAAALAAAHTVGVVHRGFKPGKVMLVEGPNRPRAVVTDFGLARGASAVAGESSSASDSLARRRPRAWLAAAAGLCVLAGWLATGRVEDPQPAVVRPGTVALAALRNLAPSPETDPLAERLAAALRRELQAAGVAAPPTEGAVSLAGSYLALPAAGQLRVDLRLTHTGTGELLAALTETAALDDLDGVVARLAGRAREAVRGR